MSARERLVQHLRIARAFARIGIVRKAQFRAEFLNQVVMDCCFYLTHILTFEFLFQHAPTIAGWTVVDVRVFLGLVFVSDAYSMVWHGQVWLFATDLKNGAIDPYRVRPASPIFTYFFQRFSLEGLANFAIASGYLGFAAVRAGVLAAPASCLALAWAVVLACFGRTLLVIVFSIGDILWVGSDLSRFLHIFFSEANDRPLDVFEKRLRSFLLYLVPIGAMSFVPAQIALGRIGPWSALAHTAFYAAFGLVAARAWRASFRRYDSALG